MWLLCLFWRGCIYFTDIAVLVYVFCSCGVKRILNSISIWQDLHAIIKEVKLPSVFGWTKPRVSCLESTMKLSFFIHFYLFNKTHVEVGPFLRFGMLRIIKLIVHALRPALNWTLPCTYLFYNTSVGLYIILYCTTVWRRIVNKFP